MLKDSVEFWRLSGLSLAYYAVGQKERSDAVLNELIEKDAGMAAYQIAEVYAFRGEKEEAFNWLDRAYRQHDTGLITVNIDRLMANIKSDPRFSAMLRKLKLPEVRYPLWAADGAANDRAYDEVARSLMRHGGAV